MSGSKAAAIVLGFIGLGVLWSPNAAHADAEGTIRVYELPCRDDCDSDDQLGANSTVDGLVQITSQASSVVGVSRMKLEIRHGGDEWVCLRSWNTSNAKSVGREFSWDTDRWAQVKNSDGCPGHAREGMRTKNRNYTLRLTITETTTAKVATETFALRFDNGVDTPQWAAEPSQRGASQRAPVVTLKWRANEEPDIEEYRYVRTDSSAGPCQNACEFAVSADDPAGQGCSVSGSVYTCEDDYFPESGFNGSYTYTLVAFRSSPAGGSCALPPQGSCRGSQAASTRSVRLVEPPPPPQPRETTSTSNGGKKSNTAPAARPAPRRQTRVLGEQYQRDLSVFYSGTYDTTLPYGDRTLLIPGQLGRPAPSAELDEQAAGHSAPLNAPRLLLLPIAGGLLLLLGAAHLARVAVKASS